MRDPETGRKIIVMPANSVVIEEVLAGGVWKDDMNRFHELKKNRQETHESHRARNEWAKSITWQLLSDVLKEKMDPECTLGIDHHTFVNPRDIQEEDQARYRAKKA